MRKGIEVVFENDDCLVINKPAGLAVQGGAGVKVSLDSLLAEALPERPFLVHRLDKDTSGLILVAKNREAAARFASAFAGKAAPGGPLIKQYLAVCAGCPEPERGLITADLEIRGAARHAQTSYRVIQSGNGYSLLELELATGRMHQIRRHLAQTGHPVLGDDKYGDFSLNRRLKKERGQKRLLLHASRLVIPESLSGFPLDLTAPPPLYFQEFVDACCFADT